MKKWIIIVLVILLAISFFVYKNTQEMTVKGKILDYNSKPLRNPELTISGLSYEKKCEVDGSGNFICRCLLCRKGHHYGIYLRDRKNDRVFALQYFSGSPGKDLEIGTRKAPWTSEE